MTEAHSLVLDVGTSGIKGFVFDNKLNLLAKSYYKLGKCTPKRGWVEQNPKEIVTKSIAALRAVVKEAKAPLISFAGLGITNQRETTILWDKETGQPVYPAIVWEDNRTARQAKLLQVKVGASVSAKTGLSIDPYFSATKINWILNNMPKAKRLLEKDRLLFGTVDTWVLWNLTQEHTHATDYTNASRTLLFNIKTLKWDNTLARAFGVPQSILPTAKPSRADYGTLHSNIVGVPLKVLAICGDQQASMFAAGNTPGKTKITYGTGTFLMQIQGASPRRKRPFFTTLVPAETKPVYALEGKIDCCGKRVDRLLAAKRSLTPIIKELAEKVDRQVKQLPRKPKEIYIDGGLTQAPQLANIQADTSGVRIRKQPVFDGTALGIAKLIGN